jgi:hypothetical protein
MQKRCRATIIANGPVKILTLLIFVWLYTGHEHNSIWPQRNFIIYDKNICFSILFTMSRVFIMSICSCRPLTKYTLKR